MKKIMDKDKWKQIALMIILNLTIKLKKKNIVNPFSIWNFTNLKLQKSKSNNTNNYYIILFDQNIGFFITLQFFFIFKQISIDNYTL